MGDGDQPASLAADMMDKLFTTARRINAASSADEVLQVVLDMVLACTVKVPEPARSLSEYVDHVAILRLDENQEGRGSPSLVSTWDRRPGVMPLYGAQHMLSGAALDLLNRGEMLIVGDVTATTGNPLFSGSSGMKLRASGIQRCLFAPLIAHQRLLGVLVIGGQQQHDFSLDEVSFYQRLAGHIAAILGDDEALRRSEAVPADNGSEVYFKSLVHNAGDPIVATDPAGVITGLNAAAETLYGYSSGEIIGQPVLTLVTSNRRPEVEAWMQTVVQEQRVIRAESEAVDSLGRPLLLSLTLSPIKSTDGTVVGVALFGVDISERMTYQTALQEERDLLEAILEATNDALVLVDPAQVVLTANLQFEVFFHLPRYQFVNRRIEDLIEQVRARADLPADLANILLTFAGDNYQSAGGDFELTSPILRTLVWYSAPVFAHDGADVGRLFVFRDATREREADRMKTEFVSLVSHEFRTPMTSVRGFTDLLLDGEAGPLDPHVQEYLEIIKFNADRLISLINDVLDITRIEAGYVKLRREIFSLGTIIDSIVQTMYPLIEGRRQCLVIRVAQDLPSVWVDLERMTQIITNLVGNASKYTPNGGEVTVEAHLVDNIDDLPSGAPGNIFLPAVLVGVHDTGMGIAPQDQSLLFTRFYRTEQASRRQIAGTGLGLTIVKSFVELHGGHVWVHSEIDNGSSFYFTIPLLGGT